ncbi:MAG: glycosyltransferase family 4 protein, partial [Candidatus Latescibacterota bacterium]
MRKQTAQSSHRDRLKIGYIASHLYRHTFEINEVAELLRQRPGTRIYSFYRPGRSRKIQLGRVNEITGEIVTWSYGSILRSFVELCLNSPIKMANGAAQLAWRSKSNPVYWIKNLIVFFVALPLLADARRHGLTHLHANFGSSPATIAWLGRKMLGTGMSIRYHSFDIHLNTIGWRDPLRYLKLRDADLVLAVHYDGIGHLKQKVPDVADDKFGVIRVGVAFDPEPKREESSEPPLVLAAGNLVPAKGFDILVRAVGILKKRGMDVRLRILGEGPERTHLASMIRENDIGDRTEMPGYYQHEEFAHHLAEAVMLVVPATITGTGVREGLPTVLVEAWLASTPVIAAPIGGIPEVVENEKTGLVFSPGDAQALADCIDQLVHSPELREKLARNGRGHARELFSLEENVRKLVEEIEPVYDAPAEPTAPSYPELGIEAAEGGSPL